MSTAPSTEKKEECRTKTTYINQAPIQPTVSSDVDNNVAQALEDGNVLEKTPSKKGGRWATKTVRITALTLGLCLVSFAAAVDNTILGTSH